MRNDLICPKCGQPGFPSRDVWECASDLKCSECGEWSKPQLWEKVKTGAEYRAEIKRLRDLIAEACDYLDTNHMTNIAHGSILHQMFKEVVQP